MFPHQRQANRSTTAQPPVDPKEIETKQLWTDECIARENERRRESIGGKAITKRRKR